jgi:cysteine synthase B
MAQLSLVGQTPLVELQNCSPGPGIRLFAKLEGQNPSGSIKDRIVAFMLRRALADGRLSPGQEVVEATTGNTGIALALIAPRFGCKVRAVVPETASPEVVSVLEACGATIERVSSERGIMSAIHVAREIASADKALLLDQFRSSDNPLCHSETTAPEIISACPDLDVFVCGIGTGGTITGVGRRLREHNSNVQLVAAEPHPGSHLQGLRSLDEGFVPPILDTSLLNGKILVRSGDAFRAVREVLHREGILAGPSSGAVIHAALKWAQRLERAKIVMIFADSGWKYLSTPVFQPVDPSAGEDELDDTLWW